MAMIKMTIIAALVSSAVFYFWGKHHGKNLADVECQNQVLALHKIIHKSNTENARLLSESQARKDQARAEHAAQIQRLIQTLNQQQAEIKNRISQSEDVCVNRLIPDGFK